MFVTTANSLNMPQPLMDRMEIIRIPGYTEDEKLEIAKRHLLPKLDGQDTASTASEWEIAGQRRSRTSSGDYTREAGVRNPRARDRRTSPARR